ncbi:MAG: GGDEF domain-containing protein [Alphaproteobacteria bacterium]
MDTPDSTEEIHRFADAALSLLKNKGYRPTPKNYTIWFSYFAKSIPDLTRLLDSILASGEELTEQRALAIYNQFFELDIEAEALRQTGAMIEASISKVLGRLDQAGQHVTRYGEKLQDYSGRLSAGLDHATVRKIVDGVLAETQMMRDSSDAIAGDIRQSGDEIDELREALENVRREAHTDSLTGISNRRSFDQHLGIALHEAADNGTPFSLLMVDIDNFKRFNDTFGHNVGDKVLQLVARILKQSVKGRDTVARFGGEEFSVVLPATKLNGAGALADQIRTAVASRRIVQKGSGEDYGTITLSIGVAEWRQQDDSDTLIGRADRCLYRAKREGRNRVVTEAQALPSAVS